MDTVARLSHALDQFAGICAVGNLPGAAVQSVPAADGITGLEVSGSVWWDKAEHPIGLWIGARDRTAGGASESGRWLRIGDVTVGMAELSVDWFEGVVPDEAMYDVVEAVHQASYMLRAASDALACAETDYDHAATLERLQAVAAESKSAEEHEVQTVTARRDIMFNCMVDLLGNMSVAESQDVHLDFDVSADTLDPVTGEPVRMRVFWAAQDDVSHNYTHAFELAGVKCSAHDDADFDRLLAAYPESSREHYRHAFVHLHQAAHAIDEYAAAQVGLALAEEGSVEEPLLLVERHALTHSLHAEVAEELDAFVKEMAGAPGRGDEHEDHQHQH